jgi:NhaP-type Na+/H+ or K+/H+ antiporter
MTLITTFILLVFLYSLASQRLERTIVTPPMLFTVAGMLVTLLPATVTQLAIDRRELLLIAELGLVMTLFTDASRVDLRLLKGRLRLPVRLLSTGLLLTIVLGAACAMLVPGGLTWWEAGILGAILAPTDAGLGLVIVSSPLVPERIRQALNVETGLNDGLSVPFLMFFMALAVAEGKGVLGHGLLPRVLGEQLGYGALIGLVIGLAGGWLLGLARGHRWMARPVVQLGVVVLPVACVLASEAAGASMFIAAFVAGLAAKAGFREVGRHSVEFTEGWGQLLNFFVFFLFGTFVATHWAELSLAAVVYGALSLTLVRMVPVALALKGTGLAVPSVVFMGWFGPRGLASIVLGLIYVDRVGNLPGENTIRLAVMATVLLSIFLHGLTAMPGIRRYASAVAALGPEAPEHRNNDREIERVQGSM